MFAGGQATPDGIAVHRLTWDEFDELALGGGGAPVVRGLRRAKRSRTLLLLRALVDESCKDSEVLGPLPSLEEAWDLLVRVQEESPAVLELVLSHPYMGGWAGYATRVLGGHIDGVYPTWVHVGHLHALAAAAAIHARLDFRASIPAWGAGAILPTLGMIRLKAGSSFSVVKVRAADGRVEVVAADDRFLLPVDLKTDAARWWSIREIEAKAGEHLLSLRLDELDPYRGPYGPMLPQRLEPAEADAWRVLVQEACQLLADCLPDFASAFAAGFESIVPRPEVAFRTPSASTEEAFGSAIIARPPDAAALAAILVHEFQHVRLSGLLHLTQLHSGEPGKCYYAPWRDDPRPLGGTLHGVVAFFGVSAFWRALANDVGDYQHTAGFEFAYWRAATWNALCSLRDDPNLTETGQRFVEKLAETLGPWQAEAAPEELVRAAASDAADHYAGWRIRHIRPDSETVAELVESWPSERSPLPELEDDVPTSEEDGAWRHARADLVRLSFAENSVDALDVPGVTVADLAYANGQFSIAASGYRDELDKEPDSPAAWIGLGLSLTGEGSGYAARALLTRPELVRAVYRKLGHDVVKPDDLAEWIGRLLPESQRQRVDVAVDANSGGSLVGQRVSNT